MRVPNIRINPTHRVCVEGPLEAVVERVYRVAPCIVLFLVKDAVELMLKLPIEQYTNEQIQEDISPLKDLEETKPIYDMFLSDVKKREEKNVS